MGVETGGDIEEERAARSVVHGAVVEAVAVDGSADAEMIEMGGEYDEFIFEGGIGAGKFGDEVGGFDVARLDVNVGLDGSRERKSWKRLAVFRQCGEFGEGVAAAGEELFSGGRIEEEREFEAVGFVEFTSGQIHGRLRTIDGNARPGDVERCGIGDSDVADCTCGAEGLPAFTDGAVMRGEGGGNVGRRAVNEGHDFAGEILGSELIEIFFGNFQSVTDENE